MRSLTAKTFLLSLLTLVSRAGAADLAVLDRMQQSICYAETFEALGPGQAGTLVEGVAGKALALVNCIERPGSATLPRAAGTLSWWCKLNFDPSHGAMFCALDHGGSLYLTSFSHLGAGDPRHVESGRLWCSLGTAMPNHPGGVKAGQWHHLALAWNVDKVWFYWDGRLNTSFTSPTSFSTMRLDSLILGNCWAPKDVKNEFVVDELRVYNRALEQEEVAAYVTAVRAGGTSRERALAVPNVLAPRRVLAARAAYRLSDHAIQLYGDLSALNAGAAGAVQTSVKEPLDHVFAGEVKVSIKDSVGREVAGETLRGCKTTGLLHRSYPLAADLPERTYRAEIAAGGLLAETRFTRVREEWENNRIGVTDKVIPPWTPMTQDGNRATCWGRQYTFGALGLPAQIRSYQPEPTWGEATKDLLAAPVELVVETPDGRLAWQSGASRLQQLGEAAVAVEGQSQTAGGELTAWVRGQLEFDGFYKFTLSLVPAQQFKVTSVRLEVPLPNALSRLFNMRSIGNMRANKAFLDLDGRGDGELWNSLNRGTNKDLNFAPHAWLGDDDRGIAFLGDSNRAGSSNPASLAWTWCAARLIIDSMARFDGWTVRRGSSWVSTQRTLAGWSQ